MKKLFKCFILITAIIAATNSALAISTAKIEKLILDSKLDNSATIAISVRNTSNNSKVYERNENKLLHPASTLKVLTSYFAVNTLGYNYAFKTGFYTDSNRNLYIKLGADPLLTTAQLKEAFRVLKEKKLTSFNNLYFDDSIIDKKEFAPGWMWDDDVNPYTPKVSSYNLDGNTIKVKMSQTESGSIKTEVSSSYPMSVYSHLIPGAKQDYIEINRYNWNSPEVIEIYGNITTPKMLAVPIGSMRRYFIHNLDNIIDDNRISIKATRYSSQLLPADAKLVYEISNPIAPTLPEILKSSNNLMAETIFKLAGGKKYNSTGTDELAISAMTDFYKDINIDLEPIVVREGCGVSRKNLVSANWMSDAVNKLFKQKDFEKFKENMSQPGEGTLSERLFDLRGETWLKTGSLANISGITGYVYSQDGNVYSVAILIQNFRENHKTIKNFEDEIIKLIYNQ